MYFENNSKMSLGNKTNNDFFKLKLASLAFKEANL